MERRFLIISLLFLFQLSGCQSIPVVINNFDVKEITKPVDEPTQIAENVWDYMVINSDYNYDVYLDKKTLTT